jgi:hypothetical protein
VVLKKEEPVKRKKKLFRAVKDLTAQVKRIADELGYALDLEPPQPDGPLEVTNFAQESASMKATIALPKRKDPTARNQRDIVKGTLIPIFDGTAQAPIELEVDIDETELTGIPVETMLSLSYFWTDRNGLVGEPFTTTEAIEIGDKTPPPVPEGGLGVSKIEREPGDE